MKLKHPVLPTLLIFLILLLSIGSVTADPLPLGKDLMDTVVIAYEEGNPEAGAYVYAYRYPHIPESEPDAPRVNVFYDYLVSDTLAFSLPMDSEYYQEIGLPVTKEVGYTVTCNNDDYFAVLIETRETLEGETHSTWTGHAFSRKTGSPGSTITLPQLLNILATDENDTWLQDRQTLKADQLLRAMVWEQIEENSDGIAYYPELTEEDLEGLFFPEEDFYLDESGNPVFYLEPGSAAPEEYGLLTFPVSLEEIRDEM